MNGFDFYDHIKMTSRNQKLMSRILLNALGHRNEYPVDVSELRFLSSENYAVTAAFLCWADLHQDFRYEGALLEGLEAVARSSWMFKRFTKAQGLPTRAERVTSKQE